MSSERIGKYARLEIERRYLLQTVPGDMPESTHGWLITDRYFPNTRLRLRHMNSLSGDEHVFKFTQKYRSETQSPDETTITNTYLTEAEYRCFERLEARIIKKKRYPYKGQARIFSIDVFEGRHRGLIMAETEFERKTEFDECDLPLFALREVTDDAFFTGGNLVNMTEAEFQRGLSQHLRDPKN